jgi:hypothetical protein
LGVGGLRNFTLGLDLVVVGQFFKKQVLLALRRITAFDIDNIAPSFNRSRFAAAIQDMISDFSLQPDIENEL